MSKMDMNFLDLQQYPLTEDKARQCMISIVQEGNGPSEVSYDVSCSPNANQPKRSEIAKETIILYHALLVNSSTEEIE